MISLRTFVCGILLVNFPAEGHILPDDLKESEDIISSVEGSEGSLSSFIDDCKEFVETCQEVPSAAISVAEEIALLAKETGAELKKLTKCRSFSCFRELQFELKDLVDSLPGKLHPSLVTLERSVLRAKMEFESCMGLINGTNIDFA